MPILLAIVGGMWRRWWGDLGPFPKWVRTVTLICFCTVMFLKLGIWWSLATAFALWFVLAAGNTDWLNWPREGFYKAAYSAPLAVVLTISLQSLGGLAVVAATFLASAAWPVLYDRGVKEYTVYAEYIYGAAILGSTAAVVYI